MSGYMKDGLYPITKECALSVRAMHRHGNRYRDPKTNERAVIMRNLKELRKTEVYAEPEPEVAVPPFGPSVS